MKRNRIYKDNATHISGALLNDTLPWCLAPEGDEEVDLIDWASRNKAMIEQELYKTGAVLFRGFQLSGISGFERFINEVVSSKLLDYTYRSTPRTRVKGKVYTSTEYPADQSIPLHNESSYDSTWAMKILFYCVIASQKGGETPIADSRRVYQRIDPSIVKLFAEKGVMYVRNFGTLDLPWQDAFQTQDKQEAETLCRQRGISFEWLGENDLRTKQICQGIAQHPVTAEMVWFNQAHLFHHSSLREDVSEALLLSMSEDELPRNAFLGDGTPIEPAILAEIRAAYDAEMRCFPWQEGDVLLLDNMLAAHGRKPFEGKRRIVVGMTDAHGPDKT